MVCELQVIDKTQIIINAYQIRERYVDTFDEEIDLMAVQAELAALETEMGWYLEELGYGS